MRSFLSSLTSLMLFVAWLLPSSDAWSQSAGDRGQWQILEARYGSAQQSVDVTQRVRDLAGSDAQFRVSNDLFGRDPHPNVVKSLRITVRGPDGQTRTFDYAENRFVDRSQFTGSNSGNWGGGMRDSGADSGW